MSCYRFAILPLLATSVVAQHFIGPGFETRFKAQERRFRDEVLQLLQRQQAVTGVDSEASQYVVTLGKRLAYTAPEPTATECRFVLYDDNIGVDIPGFGLLKGVRRVVTLPGGIILVPLTLFSEAGDEAEFSAALARSAAHVALKHWLRTVARYASLPPFSPPWRFSEPFLFTRSFESEADRAAVSMLARTGFNPDAVVRYAQSVRASFDTSETRLRGIRDAISVLPPQRTYCPDDSPQYQMLKRRTTEPAARV